MASVKQLQQQVNLLTAQVNALTTEVAQLQGTVDALEATVTQRTAERDQALADLAACRAEHGPAQTIDAFTASALLIDAGQSVTLTWSTSNATAVRLHGEVVAASGNRSVTPSATTTYALEADGAAPTVSRSVSVVVTQPAPVTGRYMVGTQPYAKWVDALAAVTAGGTITVQAGVVITESLTEILTPNIAVKGDVGAYPVFRFSTALGKGTFIISAPGVTLEHLRFENIGGMGNGAAAIRLQNPYLTVRDCQFSYCENAILTNNWGAQVDGTPQPGLITMDNCVVDHSGGNDGGRSHGIYIGEHAEVVVTNCKFYDSLGGHLIKSRAAKTTVSNTLLRKGPASRCIDISNGGVLIVDGCQFDSGTDAASADIIGYGPEIPDFYGDAMVAITPAPMFDPMKYWRDNSVTVTNCGLNNRRADYLPQFYVRNWMNGATVELATVPQSFKQMAMVVPNAPTPASIAPIPDIVVAAPPASGVISFTPGDAWWNSLVVGQVYEIADTKFIDKIVFPQGFKDWGIDKTPTIMSGWSGAAFDPAGKFYVNGGGHKDSSNNGLYGFDLETMQWSTVMQPSLITQAWIDEAQALWVSPLEAWQNWYQGINAAGQPDDQWPDGKPASVHTYTSLGYHNGRVYRAGHLHMWSWDAATGVPRIECPMPGPGMGLTVDAPNHRLFMCRVTSAYDQWTFDLATKSMTRLANADEWVFSGEFPSSCDVVGRDIVYYHSLAGKAFAVNMDTAPLYGAASDNGAWRMIARNILFDGVFGGHAFADCIGKYTFCLQTGEVGAIDPVTGATSTLALQGQLHPFSIATQNGPYGRYRYYDRRKCLVVIPGVDQNVRLARLA